MAKPYNLPALVFQRFGHFQSTRMMPPGKNQRFHTFYYTDRMLALAGDVDQDAGGQQNQDQGGAAVGDEGQGDAGQGNYGYHGT